MCNVHSILSSLSVIEKSLSLHKSIFILKILNSEGIKNKKIKKIVKILSFPLNKYIILLMIKILWR